MNEIPEWSIEDTVSSRMLQEHPEWLNDLILERRQTKEDQVAMFRKPYLNI